MRSVARTDFYCTADGCDEQEFGMMPSTHGPQFTLKIDRREPVCARRITSDKRNFSTSVRASCPSHAQNLVSDCATYRDLGLGHHISGFCKNANKLDSVPLPQSVDFKSALTSVSINRINVASYPSTFPQSSRFRPSFISNPVGPQISPLMKIRWVDGVVDCFGRASHEVSLYPFLYVRLRG